MNANSRTGIYILFLTLLLTTTTVQAQLNVNFTVDKAAGCSPLTVSFTNRTTGASANAIYKWDLGNGNTSALANPAGVYTEEKAYTVSLTVQDGSQTASKTATITVHPKPVVDFSASVVKGCIPVNTAFVPTVQTGSGNVTGCYWDFGDGVTQQSTSGLTHTYTQPQKASVILTATNNFGCYTTVSKKDFVTVLPALKAGFTAPNPVCRTTDPVQFTDTSSGPGTLSYAWNFSDGNTSTQQNPLHVFTTKGVYSVTQTVTSSEGCVASKTLNNLNVATFKTDFDAPPIICSGVPAVFVNTSNPMTANNAAWHVNNVWTYYYNTNLYYNFYTTGTYTVKLVNTFGTCKDSIEKQVSIKQSPTSNGFLTDIKNICGAPVDVEFKDTTPNAVKWEWIFDTYRFSGTIGSVIQNPVHNYTLKDQYTAQLTVTNADGCKKTISKYVNVRGPEVNIWYVNPDDQWKNARTCTNNKVGFRTYTSEEIISYNWNFGDGATSTAEKPEHIYTTAATYQVTLTYTTKKGCTAVATITNLIIAPESKITDIFASANTVCGNAPITFSANVSNPNNNWPYYYWNFGDGNTTGTHGSSAVKHQYFKDSTYTVSLIWMGGNGNCPDTMTKTGFIKVLPPVPVITAWESTCEGMRDTVTFKQKSIKAQTWTWDFGDGISTSLTTDEPVIKHIYANTGRYKVVLTTTNGACSVRDSTVVNVVKKQHPLLTANVTEVCQNSPLTFTISNVEQNPWANYQNDYWIEKLTYGDDSYAAGWWGAYLESTYTNTINNFVVGKKDLKAIIARHTGAYANSWCYDTTNIVPLTVKGPIAGYKITSNNVCYNNPAVFMDTSTSIGGTLQRWEWNFGDGQTSTSTQSGTMSHTYNTPGNYWVSLKVTDNSGCQGSSSGYYAPVQVTGPKAAFSASATTIALAGTVNFTNNTNNYNASGTTYRWQINGTDISTDYNTSYTFNQPGTYTITLIAANSISGCTSTASQVITVRDFNAAFSISTAAITPNSCPPVLVRFTNTSQNYTSIKWDFGDGTVIENVSNPSHFYEKAGKYIITLYVYGANGLSGTFYDSVTIVQPEALIQSSALDVCKGSTITLNAVASNTGSYVWDFGDGSVISTTDTFANHQYNTPGLYSPVLILKQSANGCTGAAPLADKINIRPDPVLTITPAQPFLCKGASLPLQATGGIAYEWTPATGLSNTAIANPVASPDHTSTYTIKVTDDIGCKNTGNVTITVIEPVQVSVTGKADICQGEPVNLKASGAEVYKWIEDITGLNNINIPNPVATPAVTTTYTITGSDAHSCFTDTAKITVQVRPSPSVNAGQDVELWPGEFVQLQAIGSNDVINWKWTLADYLSCTDCPSPVCTPLATHSYAIAVKNQYGCAATDTVVVKLLCNESRVRIPNGFTPNGDGKNDEFIIKGIAIVKHLVIFNRWGQKVFERNNFIAGDRSLCWNGTFKGYPAEAGTYVYFVELDCPDGTFSRKGTMTLVR